jgi:hypothetical protein
MRSDWHNGDPPGSEAPRGKNRERRKGRYDGNTWTPTEQHIKNGLMRQFMKNPEGSTNSEAYRNSSIWCRHPGCTRMNGTHSHE